MTCASCVQRVERGLKRVPGVADAVVDLADKRATVTYDPTTTTMADLIAKVTTVGYAATPLTDAALPRERDLRALAEAADQGRALPVLAGDAPRAGSPDASATSCRLLGMGILTVLVLLGSITLGGLLGDYTMRPHMPMAAMPPMTMPHSQPPAHHTPMPMATQPMAPQQTPMAMP
jgi:copper chaperone CopZ